MRFCNPERQSKVSPLQDLASHAYGTSGSVAVQKHASVWFCGQNCIRAFSTHGCAQTGIFPRKSSWPMAVNAAINAKGSKNEDWDFILTMADELGQESIRQ